MEKKLANKTDKGQLDKFKDRNKHFRNFKSLNLKQNKQNKLKLKKTLSNLKLNKSKMKSKKIKWL